MLLGGKLLTRYGVSGKGLETVTFILTTLELLSLVPNSQFQAPPIKSGTV